jgi:hypothetical protein
MEMRSVLRNLIFYTVFIIPSLQLSSLDGIKDLLQNFESKIDINFVFYNYYRENYENPYHCSAKLGPNCKFINDRSLLDYVDTSEDTIDYLSRKEKAIEYLDQVNAHAEKQLAGETDGWIVVNNEMRDAILGKNSRTPVLEFNIDVLLDFNNFPLMEQDQAITMPYYYQYGLQKGIGGFLDINQAAIIDDAHVQLSFVNVYLPSYRKIYTRKNVAELIDYEENKAGGEKEGLDPVGMYIYSSEKRFGEIRFSKPIRIKQFFMRKHNFVLYEKYRKAKLTDEKLVEYTAIGKLNGAEVERYAKKSYQSTNKWVKLTSTKNAFIDTLVFDENSDLDNLYFSIKNVDKYISDEKVKTPAAAAGDNFYQFSIPTNKFKSKDEMLAFVKEQWDQYRIEGAGTEPDITFHELIAQVEQALGMRIEDKPAVAKPATGATATAEKTNKDGLKDDIKVDVKKNAKEEHEKKQKQKEQFSQP